MNFLECILLADLSGIYDQNIESVDFIKLSQIIEEVRK
jgi:hypothetical protein